MIEPQQIPINQPEKLSSTKTEVELELEKELATPKITESPIEDESPEVEPQTESEKIIEQLIGTQGEAPQIGVPAPAQDDQPTEVLNKIKEIKNLDQEHQVQTLCELSLQKGLSYAISVARGLDNPHVLDAFHDTLTDELRQRLIQEDKLEEL